MYKVWYQPLKSDKDSLVHQINQIHVDAFNLVFLQESSFQGHGPRIRVEQDQRKHQSWMEQ